MLRRWRVVPWIAVLVVSGTAARLQAAPLVLSNQQVEGATEADDPLAKVEKLISEGRFAEAQTAVREAQSAYGRQGKQYREAQCVFLRGVAETFAGDLVAATTSFEQARVRLEAQGDRFGTWMALHNLGLLHRSRRQPAAAIDCHERSLALLREIETSSQPFAFDALRYFGLMHEMPPNLLEEFLARPEVVKSKLLRIADGMSTKAAVEALVEAGRFEEAEAKLARLTEISRQLDGMFAEEATIHLGDLRRRQWRLDEAREIFRKALDEANLQPAREKEVLELLTEIEILSGRHDEALALNDRALALARRRAEPVDVADALAVRAQIYKKRGHFDAAEAALTDALGLVRGGGNALRQALLHKGLGLLAMRADRHEKAAAHLERAISVLQAADVPSEEARIWRLLSQVYSHLDSGSTARVALERARELATKSGAPASEAMNQLQAVIIGGDLKEAERALSAVLELAEVKEVKPSEEIRNLKGLLQKQAAIRSGTYTGEIPEISGQPGFSGLVSGFVLYQRHELAAARDLWLAALDENPRRDLEVILLALIGRSYARQSREGEAIKYLIQAVDAVDQTVEDVRLEEFLSGYLGGDDKQVLFADLIFVLLRNGQIAEAFDYTERARARGFLQGLGNRRIKAHQGADPQLIKEGEELRRRILDLERHAVSASDDEQDRLSRDLREARERYQSLLVRLKVTNPEYASFTQVAPLQLQAVQEQLAPNTTLVSYFVTPPQVHAWILEKERRLRHFMLPIDADEMRGAVCWAEQLGRSKGGRGVKPLDPRCEGPIPSAEDLHQKLIAPLRKQIHHRRLVLIPHGALHYLPFAALRNPKTGRYLVEDFRLTYAPSASALHFLLGKRTPNEGRARVFGAPHELDPNLEPLPAAREEAEAVGRLFSTDPLLGRAATESRLAKLSGEVDLLHIAAHGIYEPRSPQFSRIALAPDSEHDGNLEVHEIFSDLDLSGVNLVVLSACETARGERSGGDEITSLTRAFLYAGSPAVLSTLWKIDDAASATLIEQFYQRLLAGASVAEALRQAQLSLLRNPRYSHPYYWAAFSLTGDPQGSWTTNGRPAEAQVSGSAPKNLGAR